MYAIVDLIAKKVKKSILLLYCKSKKVVNFFLMWETLKSMPEKRRLTIARVAVSIITILLSSAAIVAGGALFGNVYIDAEYAKWITKKIAGHEHERYWHGEKESSYRNGEISTKSSDTITEPPSDNTATTTTTTARIKTGDSRYDQFDSLILTSTKKYGMSSDPMMIKAMIMQESSFDQYSISSDSPCGVPNGWSNIESKSFGLMQVTPACGEGEEGGGGRPNLTRDSSSPAWATSWFNPTYNIDQGVKEYMKVMQYLKNKFGGCGESQYIKMALGGYNSGSDSIFGCTSWSNRAGTYINNVLEHYRTFTQMAG